MNNKVVLLTTGGTGGHIFPAIALSNSLTEQGYKVYFAVDERYKNYGKIDNKQKFLISSSPISGNIFKKLISLAIISLGILESLYLIIKLRPSLVIGFGGYTSFPTLIAAKILNKPFCLHEQNAIIGAANKFLLPYAKHIFTSFKKTYNISEGFLSKTIWTGNPVRKEIMELCNYEHKPFNSILKILIIGGSQSASIFSSSIPSAIKALPSELRARIIITQQTKHGEENSVKAIYDQIGVKSEASAFFKDMANQYNNHHLVISRAGASSIAELIACNKPSILIPYPYAGNHQVMNTNLILEANAGWVVKQDELLVSNISKILHEIFEHPEILAKKSENMFKLNINGLKNLTDEVIKLIK